MRYFFSAGEASGDAHASELMAALKKADPQAEFVFLGGDLMKKVAGCEPLIDYRKMAFMGFSEVLRNLRQIFKNFSIAKEGLHRAKPDAVILVDYPSFNLKLAKEANKMGIPVFYYIAPKVWAWKEWRVKQLRKYITRILSILPFEPEWFEKRGVEVTYVGNPSVEEIERRHETEISREELFSQIGLDPGKPLLTLVPGSRRGEVRNNLPVMSEVASRHPEMQAVVAGAPGLDISFYPDGTKVVFGLTGALMKHADAALVTSGTATLECALCRTPQVACYRANASKLSYNIMKLLIKSPFITLPNLIAGQEVIPEMLVHLCTVDAVNAELCKILEKEGRQKQLKGYELMREKLGEKAAAETAAETILACLHERNTNK